MDIATVKGKIETELKIQGKSQMTIKAYNFYNQKFLEFIKKDPDAVNEDDIKQFLAFLITDKGYNASSVGLVLSSLKFFYDSLLKKKVTTDIKTPKRYRKVPDVLTKVEIKELIAHAGSLRNKVIVEVMYSSGLRVSECAKLKINDLNLDEKTGLLRRGKGGKDRFFILSKQVVDDLRVYITSIVENGYLFPGKANNPISSRAIERVLERIAKRTNIKKRVYCHGLRHAFATHLLEEGVDIRLIQELLAHANLQTTQFYTKVSNKQLKNIKSPLDD